MPISSPLPFWPVFRLSPRAILRLRYRILHGPSFSVSSIYTLSLWLDRAREQAESREFSVVTPCGDIVDRSTKAIIAWREGKEGGGEIPESVVYPPSPFIPPFAVVETPPLKFRVVPSLFLPFSHLSTAWMSFLQLSLFAKASQMSDHWIFQCQFSPIRVTIRVQCACECLRFQWERCPLARIRSDLSDEERWTNMRERGEGPPMRVITMFPDLIHIHSFLTPIRLAAIYRFHWTFVMCSWFDCNHHYVSILGFIVFRVVSQRFENTRIR